MTGFEIAALVGATAWVPQIATWLYRAAVRPRIAIVAAATASVGYTTYGPILNVMIALSCSRKDAIVERIRLLIQHENGRQIDLTWMRLSETFSQIRGPAGEITEVSKDQPAIALKVGTLAVVEKIIGFQDVTFQRNALAEINDLVAAATHLDRMSN